MKKVCVFLCAFVMLFCVVEQTQAAPLNLTPDLPDISSALITVDYDASSDLLTASGFAQTLTFPPAENILGGTFDIAASIDNTGNAAGGNLNIGGTIPTLGFNSGTLLTGSLADFGFPDAGGDPLEFLFNVTGGDAAGLFGSTAGVILTQSGFAGTFESDFTSGPFQALSDTFTVSEPIPEPSTMLLLATGLVGLAGFRRKFKS